jgi:AcrR family transcriptional regulator
MSKDEVMEATCDAFRKHGYADLSIQKIADELGSGKSLIYYHFDDKEDLMESFLDYMIEWIKEYLDSLEDYDDPLDELLSTGIGSNQQIWELRKALFELRGRAPYNQKYAEKFQEIDALLLESIEQMLREKDVDNPEDSAKIVYSVFEGLVSRKMAGTDQMDLESLREKIKEMIAEDL